MIGIKSKRLNIDAVIKSAILFSFALFFTITILTEKVQLYVHPRIVPFLIFAIVALLEMSLLIMEDVFKPKQKKVNILSYLVFIIPVIMAFSLPTDDIGSSSMSLATINANKSQDSSLKLQGDTIVVEDNNFVKWVQEIYNNPEKYNGKKITVTGFVFKDKQFNSNEFVPARLMMVCCAADMTPVGLKANYNNASELQQDSWFKFSGVIVNSKYDGQQTPVINIESIEKTQKPKYEYVYPY